MLEVCNNCNSWNRFNKKQEENYARCEFHFNFQNFPFIILHKFSEDLLGVQRMEKVEDSDLIDFFVFFFLSLLSKD